MSCYLCALYRTPTADEYCTPIAHLLYCYCSPDAHLLCWYCSPDAHLLYCC